MFGNLLRFELKYHFSQITFRIMAVLFFALGMLAIHGRYGGDEVHKNAPYVIAYIVAFISLFFIFVCTLLCVNVVLRDPASKMEPIVFATSVQKPGYFLVRFCGLFMAAFFILLLAATGTFVGSFWIDPIESAPSQPTYYLRPLLVFGIPNLLLSCCLLFSTALLTKSVRAVYVTGVLLYMLYLVASIVGNSPLMGASAYAPIEPDSPGLLLDPFGLAPFFTETRNWSDMQRNSRLFPITPQFLANRALWLGFSLFVLAWGYRLFRFRLSESRETKKLAKHENFRVLKYAPVPGFVSGHRYWLAAFQSQFRIETKSLFRHIPFLLLVLLWVFVFSVELKDTLFSGPYGIHAFPATGIIVEELQSMRPLLLLIIFYTAETLGRERGERMHDIVYSTPLPGSILWAAKSACLGLLIVTLISANIFTGIAIQLWHGYSYLEIGTYLTLFYYAGLPLFLFALLTVFVQTLIPGKYLGMLANMVLIFVIVFARQLGLEHYLLRYASVPPLQYAYMNGFGHYSEAFNAYMLYWLSFAALLSVCAVGFWPRRLSDSLRQRWQIRKVGKWVLLAATIIWAGMGSYIFYQTNIAGKYQNRNEKTDWQVCYEQQYKPFSKLPQPVIKSVKTEVALFPSKALYTVKGSYRLKNESGQKITKLWAGISHEVTKSQLSVSENAEYVREDDFNQHWFMLKKPLHPGEEITLHFSLEVNRNSFQTFNTENAVVSNGSYVELEKYVPFLGYRSDFETKDITIRKKNGLPPIKYPYATDLRDQLIDFETTISTEPDQQVLTVGTLKKSWETDNRRFFHYKTDGPIHFMFAFSSARYSFKKQLHKGVEIRIAYQPGQEANLRAMMLAMRDALDYCDLHFGKYPLKNLTLAEIPHYRAAATAYPGIVFSAERISFLGDFSDKKKTNHAYAITVHEIAHQWWANRLAPAPQPGADLLTESLAKYTEAMVMEKRFGKTALATYLKADNHMYFALRENDKSELPLVETVDQNHVHYQKGGLAMYALKETLGETTVNKSLRQLILNHAKLATTATAEELVTLLGLGATEDQQKSIDHLLKRVITYEIGIKPLSCRKKGAKYELEVMVSVKPTDQQTGKVVQPAGDFEIAAFADQSAEPFYSQKHHFTKTETSITLILGKKPASVAIDPYGYMLDADQQDHVAKVKESGNL